MHVIVQLQEKINSKCSDRECPMKQKINKNEIKHAPMFIQKFTQQFIPVKSVHKTFTLINYLSGPFNRIYPQGSYIPARLMQVQTHQQEQTPRRESLSPLALPYCQVNTTCFLCSVDPIYFIFKLEQTLHTSLVIFLFAETMLHHYGSSSRISNSLNNATV